MSEMTRGKQLPNFKIAPCAFYYYNFEEQVERLSEFLKILLNTFKGKITHLLHVKYAKQHLDS